MRKCIITVLVGVFLSACSSETQPNINSINKLSNDQLCKYYGKEKENGDFILKVHDEIIKRGADLERCYVLGRIEQEEESHRSVTPIIREPRLKRIYNKKNEKYETKKTSPRVGINITW